MFFLVTLKLTLRHSCACATPKKCLMIFRTEIIWVMEPMKICSHWTLYVFLICLTFEFLLYFKWQCWAGVFTRPTENWVWRKKRLHNGLELCPTKGSWSLLTNFEEKIRYNKKYLIFVYAGTSDFVCLIRG